MLENLRASVRRPVRGLEKMTDSRQQRLLGCKIPVHPSKCARVSNPHLRMVCGMQRERGGESRPGSEVVLVTSTARALFHPPVDDDYYCASHSQSWLSRPNQRFAHITAGPR